MRQTFAPKRKAFKSHDAEYAALQACFDPTTPTHMRSKDAFAEIEPCQKDNMSSTQ